MFSDIVPLSDLYYSAEPELGGRFLMNEKRNFLLMWSYSAVRLTEKLHNFLLERHGIVLFDDVYAILALFTRKKA